MTGRLGSLSPERKFNDLSSIRVICNLNALQLIKEQSKNNYSIINIDEFIDY